MPQDSVRLAQSLIDFERPLSGGLGEWHHNPRRLRVYGGAGE